MESEDREPVFTKRLILTILVIILIVLIILLLLRRCGNGGGEEEVISITINPSEVTLKPNDSQELYAQINSDDVINWVSSDTTCVTVEGNNNNATVRSYDRECSTVITAYSGNVTKDVLVTVKKTLDPLIGLQLNKSIYNVRVGGTVLAATTAVPTTAELPILIYSIDNPKIATINENGVIKGISVGDTVLTVMSAEDPTIMAKSTIHVYSSSSKPPRGDSDIPPTEVPITGLEFNKNNEKEVCVDKTIKLAYNLKPNNTTYKEVNWTLDNPTDTTKMVNKYAKVDAKGNVTGISAGTVKVSLTSAANPKASAETTIKVLPASNSKCKTTCVNCGGGNDDYYGGGGSDSYSSNAMTCTVTSGSATSGWITSYKVSWSAIATDDSYYDREYCIGGNCTKMYSSSYTYVPKDNDTITNQYFGFKYKHRNSNGKEETLTGYCPFRSGQNVKVDSTKPTCSITSEKVDDNGNVKVFITASDNVSGVKTISLDGETLKSSGNENSITTSKVYNLTAAKTFTGIAIDVAGNKETCQANVNPNGTSDNNVFYYTEARIIGPSSVNKGVTNTYSIYFVDNNGKSNEPKNGELTISGATVEPESSGILYYLTSSNNDSKITITLSSNKGLNGKKVEKAMTVTVDTTSTIDCSKISADIAYNSNNPWHTSPYTVSATAKKWNDTTKTYESLSGATTKVCASKGGTCTPTNNTVTVSESGKYTVYYTVSTSTGSCSGTTSRNVYIDNDKPTCSVTTNGDDFVVKLSDAHSGLSYYEISDSDKKGNLNTLSTSYTLRTKDYNGKTVTVRDAVGNQNTCLLKANSTVGIDHISLTSTHVELYVGDTKTIAANVYDTTGNINTALNGFTVQSGYDNCISVQASSTTGVVKITANKKCSNDVSVTLASNRDMTKTAVFTVKVKEKSVSTSCKFTLSSDGKTVTLSGNRSGNGLTIKSMLLNGLYRSSMTYNPVSGLEGVVSYSDGNSERCEFAATVLKVTSSSSTLSNGQTASLTSTISNGSIVSAMWTPSAACLKLSNVTNVSTTVKNENCATGTYYIKYTARAKNALGTFPIEGSVKISSTNTVSPVTPVTITGNSNIAATGTTKLTGNKGGYTSVAYYNWTSSDPNCATVTRDGNAATVTGKNTNTNACMTTIHAVGLTATGNKVQGAEAYIQITVGGKVATEEDFSCKIVSQNDSWTNEAVTVKAVCEGKDCNGTQNGIQYTISANTTSSVETYSGLYVISKSGARKACSAANVKYDTIKPNLTCTVTGSSTAGVQVSVTASDADSGLLRKPPTSETIKSTKAYTAIDNAGNQSQCVVKVYVGCSNDGIYNPSNDKCYYRSSYQKTASNWEVIDSDYYNSDQTSQDTDTKTTCQVFSGKSYCDMPGITSDPCYYCTRFKLVSKPCPSGTVEGYDDWCYYAYDTTKIYTALVGEVIFGEW